MDVNRWIHKEDVVYIYIYIMEYYSAIEKNKILSCAMCITESIMLSKTSQSEKDK